MHEALYYHHLNVLRTGQGPTVVLRLARFSAYIFRYEYLVQLRVPLPALNSMAIISATNLLCSISLFHLTIAYFFLVSPSLIADHNLVYIFGAAMDLVSQMRLMDFRSYTRFSRVFFFPLIITLPSPLQLRLSSNPLHHSPSSRPALLSWVSLILQL